MTTQAIDNGPIPAPSGNVVSVEVRPDGVAIFWIDDPSASVNTVTEGFGKELLAAIDRLEHDQSIRAGVLASKKEDFIVGANIEMLRNVKFASDAERMAKEMAQGVARIRTLKKPLVAAVNGQALGGGLEVALACHAIVLSSDKRTGIGLPEVKLGLLPGCNGLLRVAERAGLQVAIDLGLTGRTLRPTKAKALNLADEVCPGPVLVEAAAKRALGLVGKVGPGWKKAREHHLATFTPKELTEIALEENPLGRRVLFSKARQETRRKTKGHYPATERILDVLETYGKRGFAAAAELEAKSFGELVVSETSHRLVEIFFATTALKKDTGTDDVRLKVRTPTRIAMVGGGLMGGGIAYVSIASGINVRLKDKDDAGIARGLKYVRGILDERTKKKSLTPAERDQTFALLTGTTDYSGFRNVDVVIEAVFEDLALKHRVLKDVEAVTRQDCIFASNTSSIPIAKIAEASSRPETVVGMHYFSPVHKMPLLEVIRTDKAEPWAIATAVALGKKQGKTVIVVKDGVGFYTSRILGPYLNEAAYMVTEGVPVDAIDEALVEWGWPVGAIQLMDEVGIDVGAHVAGIMLDAFGERMSPPGVMTKLIENDRKGRKNGRGFYLYEGDAAKKKGRRPVDPTVYTALGVEPKARLPHEEIQMRCSLQMVNEAIYCFGEGILRSPRDGDIGAMFGLGFPPFRGGPFRYVDTVGPAEVLRRIQGYKDRFGIRWEPAPVLVEMAKSGKRFYKD
jgi:3-hydroxyacyl-CoA dehydrogenase/enoyl-CoA hydratase/3-hydroxybutyryl-CoA epimerase